MLKKSERNKAGELCMKHKLITSSNKSSYNVSQSWWQISKNHETYFFIPISICHELIFDPFQKWALISQES